MLIFFPLISLRERSSHTREKECSPSQEKWREDRADHRDWEDRETSPSADTARDRERSLSYERDRRSSSDERESGEIWTEGENRWWFRDLLFSWRFTKRYSCWCKCVSGCSSALYVYSCLNVVRDERWRKMKKKKKTAVVANDPFADIFFPPGFLRRLKKEWIRTKWKPYFQSRFISLGFKCCFCL